MWILKQFFETAEDILSFSFGKKSTHLHGPPRNKFYDGIFFLSKLSTEDTLNGLSLSAVRLVEEE